MAEEHDFFFSVPCDAYLCLGIFLQSFYLQYLITEQFVKTVCKKNYTANAGFFVCTCLCIYEIFLCLKLVRKQLLKKNLK